MKLNNILSITILAVGSSGTFAADGPSTLRCRNDLVQLGDSKASTTQKCGEPAFKDSFCKPQPAASAPAGKTVVVPSSSCEQVDEWTYKPGYGQFLTTLRFESGRLVSIRYGERTN